MSKNGLQPFSSPIRLAIHPPSSAATLTNTETAHSLNTIPHIATRIDTEESMNRMTDQKEKSNSDQMIHLCFIPTHNPI